MKTASLTALVAGASLLLASNASANDIYLGGGGGIQHTKDWAVHLAAPVRGPFEAHYTYWKDERMGGHHVSALGVGHRWHLPWSFSFVFGGAYINRVTDNLLRHVNAYFEVRWRPLETLSCQLGHYSSIGDDTGENVLLCGLHWQLGR